MTNMKQCRDYNNLSSDASRDDLCEAVTVLCSSGRKQLNACHSNQEAIIWYCLSDSTFVASLNAKCTYTFLYDAVLRHGAHFYFRARTYFNLMAP